jgi:hypothetical protein
MKPPDCGADGLIGRGIIVGCVHKPPFNVYVIKLPALGSRVESSNLSRVA